MSCTICGQATLPGAMLCRPCKAALKRARYLSVQDLPRASILRPRRSKGSVSKRAGPGTAQPNASATIPEMVPASPSTPSSARHLFAGAAAIAILALVAYVGQRHMSASATDAGAQLAPRETPVALSPMPDPGPAVALPAVPVVAAPESSPAPATPTAPADSAGSGGRPAGAGPAPARARPPPAPRPDPNANLATRPEVSEPVVAPPPPLPPPPAPVARPAPPPDRWQTMSNALSQCAREGGFSGIVCDQRVRLESCEGYWGRVPQCPLPPENPGGQ